MREPRAHLDAVQAEPSAPPTLMGVFSGETWHSVEPLLDQALALEPELRGAFLDEACAADPAMREELERMIAECEHPDARLDALLDRPAAERFASLWDEAEDLARLQAALSGRYLLEREAGRGGMGTVYRARDLRHRRPVAFKVVRSDLTTQEPARFRREVEFAASLQHPHIVPVFDSGEIEGRLWYTMPFVEGESLGARLRREGPLPLPEAVRLLREIADALAYAHEQAVVHRDLKPDNVLLSRGHALVADFGVAKALVGVRAGWVGEGVGSGQISVHDPRPQAPATAAGLAVGTPEYMAPEQAAGDPAADHRADLYSLGVLAHEMLFGARPASARPPQALLPACWPGAGNAPSTDGVGLPPPLDALISRLLEGEAEKRPRSAGEVLEALDALATRGFDDRRSTPPVEPEQPRHGHWGAAHSHRMRAAFAAAVVAGLALAGGSTWLLSGRQAAQAAARVLVVPFENSTGDSTLAPLGRMAADWVAAGLAQTGVVEVTSEFGSPGAAGGPALRSMAARSGAGTVVFGSYYLDGDTIRLQARVTNAERWTLLRAIAPVSAPKEAPQRLLEPLRQRVMAVLAVARDPRWAGWDMGTPPPTYAAYEQYVTGRDLALAGNWRGALEHWAHAAALDSSYVQPLLSSIDMHVRVLDEPAAGDSLVRLVERRRQTLTPIDRAWLDRARAEIAGDRIAALAAARAMAQAAPRAPLPLFLHGAVANRANRPREALEALSRISRPSSYVRTGWGGQIYWEEVANAHHMLTDYLGELTAARTARTFFPENRSVAWLELRALGALGRVGELNLGLDALERTPPIPGGGTMPALLIALAEELEAHGQREAGQNVLRRAVAWHGARLPEEQRTRGARADLAYARFLLGEYQEAERLFSELVAEEPENLRHVTLLGMVAAQQGRDAEAQRSAERLRARKDPYDRGQITYARARLAAARGDRTLALTLLSQAVAEGLAFHPGLHSDPALAPLREHRRFRELLKPKG